MVILVTAVAEEGEVVTVLPITHTPPSDPLFAVEIPPATKQRLHLDDERSWVGLTEANRFLWPGPDLRPARGEDAASVAYGLLPYGLSEEIRRRFIAYIKAHRVNIVPRTE